MRRVATLLLALSAVVFTACSTHEPEFENKAPPRLTTADAVRATTDRLITRPAQQLASASPDVLAPLTRAAAIQFRATGGTGMRTLTRRYADALLDGRITVNGVRGYYSGTRTRDISSSTTLRAGIALAAAYEATNDPRYASAVREIASSATRPEFGLEPFRDGYAMRTRTRPRRLSVALTALAAEFFDASSGIVGNSVRPFARGALQTVAESQAAVGRWYAFIGSKTPMSLEQWGSTLTSLSELPFRSAQGIMGAGMPAIADAAFTKTGNVRPGTLTSGNAKGVAHAMQALASGQQQPQIKDVFVQGSRLLNGSGGGADAEAELALAFAIWQRALART